MNRDSYEKQLVRQKIESHREIMRYEWQSLRGNNPVASAFSLGASLVGGRGSLLKSTSLATIPALIFAVLRWRKRRAARSRQDGD